MKKVGKKGIKGRRMVKSTNKKPARASTTPKVSVKDAKAASKKLTKTKKAAKKESDEENDEEDKEMTHTEVNEVSEDVEEQINTQSKGRVSKKAPAKKRAPSVPKVGQKRLRIAPKKDIDEEEEEGSED